LKHWVTEHYLKGIGRPEFHLYDSDVEKYAETVDEVNERGNQDFALQTKKMEIENYLHRDAIKAGFDLEHDPADQLDADGNAAPKSFSLAYAEKHELDNPWSDKTAKKKLAARAFPEMTAKMIDERDPDGEVRSWFNKIIAMLQPTLPSYGGSAERLSDLRDGLTVS